MLAFSLGTASAAVGWAVRARLEDRRAGGDREAALARRRGLLDGLRRRLAEGRERAERLVAQEIPIGRTQRGELVCVPRGSADSGRPRA